GDLADEIPTDERGQGARPFGEPRRLQIVGRNDALLGAAVAQVPGQGPRVDALDADHSMSDHILVERHAPAPARDDPARLADEDAVHPRSARLRGLLVQAVAAAP